MLNKILIANRGEIACRIIETCDRLGVGSVAVFSEIDRNARHVMMAGEAVALGGQAASESYLRGDAIIEAALSTGAEAIHPGYGFLSENPEFVEAVEAAGLIFIGPSAKAIRAMGLKDAAKALMEEAGVPVVPGYHGADQDNMAARAKEIGYPILIKAVAGGGGKGMRRVDRPEDFADALQAARAEGRGAFGNGDVLVEKYVEKPRHIEVQIFGDETRAIHLFERDCSLQRRHQKVIEEAPAPGMTEAMRAAMGQAAVRAAEAVGYSGAGTVEFIVDASDGLREDGFYFMEMNTRLQVEHPVTEAITGIDLVEWQLRVAAGEPLPLSQDQLAINGHAFEARLYAEDVPAGFLPATGVLEHLQFPDAARIDTGVQQGDEISPFYDPMIAKVTVHGADRPQALAKLTRALEAAQIAGTTTNLGFLAALSGHEGFACGQVDTALIARDLDSLIQSSAPCSRTRAIAAVWALGLEKRLAEAFALWTPLVWSVTMCCGDEEVSARVLVVDGAALVDLGDVQHRVAVTHGRCWVDDQMTRAQCVRHSDGVTVFWKNTYAFGVADPMERLSEDIAGDAVMAPMPGLVKALLAAPGDHVAQGDRLAVLEAMKMEHVLTAPRDGVIAQIGCVEGAQVAAGDLLVRLEEET